MSKTASKRAAGKRKRRKPLSNPIVASAEVPKEETLVVPDATFWKRFRWPLAGFVVAFLFAYWPTLRWIEDAWRNEPDYSHGYLVPFLAGLLLWYRRDSFPGISARQHWAGLSLIGLAIVMRFAGRLVYADFLDAWSMLPMLAGGVWLLFGWRAMRWSLPVVVFLLLMIPLPYQAESMLSWKLQGIATEASTVFLRVLGQPAVSEGHVIWLGDQPLLVEQACSGLRIFIGVAALAFFWAALANRSWVDRLILVAAVVPLAVFVNAVRITVVGLLYEVFESAEHQHTIHDISGYLMIPLAFGLLWVIKAFWENLYRPVEQLTARDFVGSSA